MTNLSSKYILDKQKLSTVGSRILFPSLTMRELAESGPGGDPIATPSVRPESSSFSLNLKWKVLQSGTFKWRMGTPTSISLFAL